MSSLCKRAKPKNPSKGFFYFFFFIPLNQPFPIVSLKTMKSAVEQQHAERDEGSRIAFVQLTSLRHCGARSHKTRASRWALTEAPFKSWLILLLWLIKWEGAESAGNVKALVLLLPSFVGFKSTCRSVHNLSLCREPQETNWEHSGAPGRGQLLCPALSSCTS